jgi:hypothetical protein
MVHMPDRSDVDMRLDALEFFLGHGGISCVEALSGLIND